MKRPILAQLHRGQQILWSRHYTVFSNAARRATELALLSCQPRDVIEFSDSRSGLQIGTLQVSTSNRLELTYSAEVQRLNALIESIKEST